MTTNVQKFRLSALAEAWSPVAAIYATRPGTVTLLCSFAALLIIWCRPLFFGAVIPYDYQTAHYPWYVDAVRAARYSIFCLYNPFNDAGQPVWNIAAFDDPIEWLPAIFPGLPGYASLQSLELLHLALIPCGLLLVARANGIPKERWIFIAVISAVAYAVGPTLKLMQQSVALVSYGYLVLAFGALEAFRTTGRREYAILAGASIAYVFEAFVYPAIFLPIALVGYAFANGKELVQTRQRLVSLALGAVTLILIALPSAILSVKIDRSIDIALHLVQNRAITLRDIPSMFGAPQATLGLIALPAALMALVFAGCASLNRRQAVAYGIAFLILVVYGFGASTPLAAPIRAIYVPAGLIRRPYTVWYVIVPFLLVLATIGLRLPYRGRAVRLATTISFIALLAQAAIGIDSVAAIVVALTLLLTLWRPNLELILPVLFIQWLAIDWMPFSNSPWQPEPIPLAFRYDAALRGLDAYRGAPASSSLEAFRIANIGLPAEIGPSAGMYQYYNVAADFNTFIPHTLVRELGTSSLHAKKLMPYIMAHPNAVGSPPWQRLATKYYFVGPTVFASISATVAESRHLHVVPTGSYWHVIEDDAAAPFVSGLRADASLVPIDARMKRDAFSFTVPPKVTTVRFALNYDSWWHVADLGDGTKNLRPIDDNGQLTLSVIGLFGHRISLIYSDRWTVVTIALTIAAQLGLVGWLCFLALRRASGLWSS